MYLKAIGLRTQIMLTIPGSIINIIGEGVLMWPFNEHKNIHFDDD